MKKYIGSQIVLAKQNYNKLTGDDGYDVTRNGVTTWEPKTVFEMLYRQTDGMSFGLAIEAMKLKQRVARIGWNGKGMYLGICEGGGFRDGYRTTDFIYMKTADDKITPWLASQADMLSEDWVIVEKSQ